MGFPLTDQQRAVVDDRGAFVGIVTRQTIMRKLIIPAVETHGPKRRELQEALV